MEASTCFDEAPVPLELFILRLPQQKGIKPSTFWVGEPPLEKLNARHLSILGSNSTFCKGHQFSSRQTPLKLETHWLLGNSTMWLTPVLSIFMHGLYTSTARNHDNIHHKSKLESSQLAVEQRDVPLNWFYSGALWLGSSITESRGLGRIWQGYPVVTTV